jgi:DNA-binding MarR family transcriptional regulator
MAGKRQAAELAGPEAFEAATRLHSLAIHLLRAVRSRDRASGIGPAQLSALSVLVFGGDRSPGELADAEQVRPPTMTRIIAGLERASLVRRHKTADKRQIRLTATPKGIRLLHEAQKRRVELLASVFAKFSAADIRKIKATADLVRSALSSLN